MNGDSSLRLGIVGLGNIALQHIDNVLSGAVQSCDIVAVCSRRGAGKALCSSAKVFTDYREMIDSGICEAVLIATPTYSHRVIGEYALQAGLHVLMEKPLGLSLQEAEDLVALHRDEQVFALMLNQRRDPVFETMRNFIGDGRLGEITRTQWTMTNWFRPEIYFKSSDWRATWKGEGGGLLLNQCIHNLDIFQWLAGMPQSLTAFVGFGRYHDIEVEDEAMAVLQYENGATGLFAASTGEAPGINRLDVVGDKGTLSFDGERLLLTENSVPTSVFSRDTRDMFGMPENQTTDVTPDRDCNQHAGVLNNFCAAIATGAELTAPASEGLPSLALANAMLLSAWESRQVSLPLSSAEYQAALDRHLAISELRKQTDSGAVVDMNASYR